MNFISLLNCYFLFFLYDLYLSPLLNFRIQPLNSPPFWVKGVVKMLQFSAAVRTALLSNIVSSLVHY
jgi:hypothetical protein